jgi:solute:Na+ symporter, SSS family
MTIWLLSGFFGYLLLLLCTGLLLSRPKAEPASLDGFYLANRRIPSWMLGLTFVAAWFGAGSTMGTLQAAFENGLSAIFLIAVPSVLSLMFITLCLAKKVQQSEALSLPQAVKKTYGEKGAFLMAIIMLLASTTFIASELTAAGQLLSHTLMLDPLFSVSAMMTIVVAYSMLGGFNAVVATDLLQFVSFTFALLILVWWTLSHASHELVTQGAGNFYTLSTHWPETAVMVLTFTMGWSIAPEMWQRMQAARTPHHAQKASFLASLVLIILFVLVLSTGWMARGLIPAGSQSVLASLAFSLPHPLLTTLVLIGVLSAITSTIDSTLSVASLTLSQDILAKYKPLSEKQRVLLAKLAMPMIALPALFICLHYQNLIHTLWISADIYASAMFIPVLALFYGPTPKKIAGILAMIMGAIPILITLASDLSHFQQPPWWPQSPYILLWGLGLSALGYTLGQRFGCENPVGVVSQLPP